MKRLFAKACQLVTLERIIITPHIIMLTIFNTCKLQHGEYNLGVKSN